MAAQKEGSPRSIRRFLSAVIGSVWLMVIGGQATPAQVAMIPSGRVTGRVYCADTGRPARLATVTVLPDKTFATGR